MKNLQVKFKLLFLPVCITAVLFCSIYTFLHWAIIIKPGITTVNEELTNYWLPMTLPWIPILLWIRPRIKLLAMNRKKGNLPFLYILVSAFCTIGPTIVAQTYIETATGALTTLDTIREINNYPATKYYAIAHHYINKAFAQTYYKGSVSGKYGSDLDLNLFVVCPLLDTTITAIGTADTTIRNDSYNRKPGGISDTDIIILPPVYTKPVAWICIYFSKTISNRDSREEKDRKENAFYHASMTEFANTDYDTFIYLDRIGFTNHREGYKKAIDKTGLNVNSRELILMEPKFNPYSDKNGNSFPWIFRLFGIGIMLWVIMILIPRVDKAVVAGWSTPKTLSTAVIRNELSMLIPKGQYFITPLIVDVNLLVFIAMVVSGIGVIDFSAGDLLNWGANYQPLVARGDWWRPFTSTFVHGGLMHILANMVALIFAGMILEPVLGRVKYTACYILAGLAASATSLWWHPNTVSVGASGAIFGLYGICLALIISGRFPKATGRGFLVSILIFTGYNLLIGAVGSNIDNAAHIGGLTAGFIIGFVLSTGLPKQHEQNT